KPIWVTYGPQRENLPFSANICPSSLLTLYRNFSSFLTTCCFSSFETFVDSLYSRCLLINVSCRFGFCIFKARCNGTTLSILQITNDMPIKAINIIYHQELYKS